MPFFWDTLMRDHGSIAGNRARGSHFGVTNRHRFSYPGYAEILTGAAHDEDIDSNDNKRYPYPDRARVPARALGAAARAGRRSSAPGKRSTGSPSTRKARSTINAGYEVFETPIRRDA